MPPQKREKSKGCCFIGLAVFAVILGVAFGIIFGVIPLDDITSALGLGTDNSDGSSSGGGSGSGGGEDSYQHMQCPETGDCCNGLQSNCNLRPSEMLWPTVHNAMHDDLLGANNEAPLEDALKAGYRGMLLDVCQCDGVLKFCHGHCDIGNREFDEVWPNINTFLNENPTEVLLINIEISSGSPTPSAIWAKIKTYDGIMKKTYNHSGGKYPTMKTLLDDNRQLIMFKHNGVDCSSSSNAGCTPRIPEFFNVAVETPYTFENVDAVEDTKNSCKGDRGTGGSKDFYHINNFVTSMFGPSRSAADTLNSKSFLEKRIADCKAKTGWDANLISIDFWQRGDTVEVAQEMNKARANRRRRALRSGFLNWFGE
mmetsp:Transcript_10448/g.11532  ORF Transcript_10448/g.11532 Transcript_10448/m.11532 type:complete len:369 (-) Transcript_10448:208-1314(-)